MHPTEVHPPADILGELALELHRRASNELPPDAPLAACELPDAAWFDDAPFRILMRMPRSDDPALRWYEMQAAKPFFELAGAAVAAAFPDHDPGPGTGCPVCGEAPFLAERRTENKIDLYQYACGLCAHRWTVAAGEPCVICAAPAERVRRAIPGVAASAPYFFDVCATCRVAILGLDRRDERGVPAIPTAIPLMPGIGRNLLTPAALPREVMDV
jgi:hypothetical protein